MLLPSILIPACNSSRPAFLMICSAYRLNKQGDSRQRCCIPFSILNQSVVLYRILTVASWPAHRFLRRQVRWSGIPISFKSFPQFIMIHTVKGFGVVDETEVDVSLEFLGFLYDPLNVGNLISGSSSFSKASLDIWKFLVLKMLKPSLQDFSMSLLAREMSAIIRCSAHSLVLSFLGTGMRIELFQPCGHCWVFQICWHIECNTLMASSFRVLNSSTKLYGAKNY